MKRREFITLAAGAATWPIAARAQQPAIPVIGYVNPGSDGNSPENLEGFRRGLLEADFVEGRDVRVEYRWAEGRYDRLPALTADLVQRGVTVIAALGSSAPGLAAKAATKTIPIVFQTGGDPVADGLVASMNRPGGNVTGVSRFSIALDPKRVELLHEAVPNAEVFAFLVNQRSPRANDSVLQVQGSARTLGLKLVIPNVSTEYELEAAFAIMKQQRVGALLVGNDPTMNSWTDRIVALAVQYSYPAMFNVRSYVVAGGLMSYDASITDSFRQAGVYVGRILKGEKPAELPIRNPIKFDFILNLKTAKALGLEIPLKVHAFANEVIE